MLERNSTTPLKLSSDSSARKEDGTETRPFLSILLICVDKNKAMRPVKLRCLKIHPAGVNKMIIFAQIKPIMEKHGYLWNIMGNNGRQTWFCYAFLIFTAIF